MFNKIGLSRFNFFSQNNVVRLLKDSIKLFLARTEYEASYLSTYGLREEQTKIVPLTYRSDHYNPLAVKEPFCLFVGTMTHQRKNVVALIKAAKKHGFRLVLAGSTGDQMSWRRLETEIGGSLNIEVKGFISEEELADLYNRAKVFALPSLNEGVGLVALEAAVCGCNIVITELGGPKEYYNGLAYLVNPHNVDDIGLKVMEALRQDSSPPSLLREHIIRTYNPTICTDKLIDAYASVSKQ